MAPAYRGHSGSIHIVCWRERTSALTAGTLRPVDHAPVRCYDALPHHGTVRAVGVIFVTTPAVAGSHAKSERAHLNARTAGGRAQIDLSGGRNGRNERARCCRGHQEFPHHILLSPAAASAPSTPQAGRCCDRIKKLSDWNQRRFRSAPADVRRYRARRTHPTATRPRERARGIIQSAPYSCSFSMLRLWRFGVGGGDGGWGLVGGG